MNIRKKILLFLFTILTSWRGFSQIDTNKVKVDSIVCIKKEIATKIARDLVKLDEYVLKNKVLDSNIVLLKNQVKNRDSAINLQYNQLELSNKSFINAGIQYSIVNKQVSELNKSLKVSKSKTTISQLGFLALLLYGALKK